MAAEMETQSMLIRKTRRHPESIIAWELGVLLNRRDLILHA